MFENIFFSYLFVDILCEKFLQKVLKMEMLLFKWEYS